MPAILLWTTILWLALSTALAAQTGAKGARHELAGRVPVELVQLVRLTDVEIEAIRDQLTRIWRQEDVEIVFRTPSAVSMGRPQLRLVFTDIPIQSSAATRNLCALGSIRFVNGIAEPELLVSVTTVREFVRRARLEQSPGVRLLMAARILGRVAAHEMGHYLLGEAGHRPTGLMRARFDGADLLAPHLQPFAPPQRAQLAAGLTQFADDAAK